MVRRLCVLLAPVALAACTRVGPDYHLPAGAMVSAPAAQGGFAAAGPATIGAAPPDQWWRLYDDPVLDRLVAEALAANTDLRAAEANLARSAALLDGARSGRQVQAGVSAETSFAQRSAEQVLQHVQPKARQTYDLGLAVSYDLDLFGGIRRGIEAAGADSEAAMAARDLVRIKVAAETARAWAEICTSGRQLAALEAVVAIQTEDLRLTRMLVAHGRAVPLDVDRRDAALAAVSARLAPLAASRRNAAVRLATLLGRPPALLDQTWLRCAAPLRIDSPLPVGDGRSLLARRPDVRLAERRLAADTARIGVAMAALYPAIRLGGTIGSTGAAADVLSALTNRFAFGPLISWAVNRSAARARITASRAQADADLAAFDGTVLTALQETENALARYAGDLDRQRQLVRAADEAQQVADDTRRMVLLGRLARLAMVGTDRDLAQARLAVAEGEAGLSADQIAVFMALGGGWNQSSGEPEPAR